MAGSDTCGSCNASAGFRSGSGVEEFLLAWYPSLVVNLSRGCSHVPDVYPQVFPGAFVLDRPGDFTGVDGGLESLDVLRSVVRLAHRLPVVVGAEERDDAGRHGPRVQRGRR